MTSGNRRCKGYCQSSKKNEYPKLKQDGTTEQLMMALNSQRRELDTEKWLFEHKCKRAKRWETRIHRALKVKRDSEPSDIDSGQDY